MAFLEFPDAEQKKSKIFHSKKVDTTTKTTKGNAEKILNRVPPKIESIKSSEVLSRAAAFLPQLAASNRAILQKRPEDVNIEVLNGQEGEVIEMKLGLGVFEEKTRGDSEGSVTDETDSSDTESESFNDKKILILPSEIRAAAAAQSKGEPDPFEKIINSLLFFATDDESEEVEQDEDEEMNVLD